MFDLLVHLENLRAGTQLHLSSLCTTKASSGNPNSLIGAMCYDVGGCCSEIVQVSDEPDKTACTADAVSPEGTLLPPICSA
mmetsp:Transcript_71742/g.149790  ORF Transcript_71742/g.149790 Transcript_71742/m.149790 type:complete len:81 (+) Transcript_71742:74-316(+)